jgi:hypothetical protein
VVLSVSTSLGVGLGVMRGMTFRLWTDRTGRALMRATALTLLLWAITIGVKIGLTVLIHQAGLGQANTNADALIPAAATLAAQNVVVYLRARDHALVAA